MYLIHIYDKDFNQIRKIKAIGSLDQITEGSKVKLNQIPKAKYIHIYKGLDVVMEVEK